MGAKKQPSYRVVVTDSRSPRDGRFIETIGHYNPRTEPPTVEIDAARALYWLSVGAQPSEAVKRMLDKMGVMSQATAIRKGDVSIDEVVAKAEAAKAETAKAEAVKAKVQKVEETPEPAAAIEEMLELDDEDVDEEDFEDLEDFAEPDGDEDEDVDDDEDDDYDDFEDFEDDEIDEDDEDDDSEDDD
jgi:small subunit ribosomal protein S16